MEKRHLSKHLSAIRREMSKDFKNFRKIYFPHYHKVLDATFHGDICQLLCEMTEKRGKKIAIAGPRSSAKSTIVTLEYVLFCICHKLEPFIWVISSTSGQVEDFLRNIKLELTTNLLLMLDFPEVCEVSSKLGPPRWTKDQIITRNGVNLLVLSVNQQVRGRRHGEYRPSLIVLDDVEADESTRSAEGFYKLQDKITKSIILAGSATTNIVYVGTIHHYGSVLAQFTGPSGVAGWTKRIYRSIISWSVHPELWEKWIKMFHNQEQYNGLEGMQAARAFFEDNKIAMLEGTEVLWPQARSYYDLMVEREQIGYISFDAELQNEPVNPRDCHFSLAELNCWDDQYRSEDELLGTIEKHMRTFGSCDPSMGKQNRRADYSAILSCALDTDKNIIYILDADVARRKPDKTIDDIIAYHRRRKYHKFAFETNQFQEYMATVLDQKARATGEHLNIEQVKHLTNKQARIEALQPLVKNGTIRFSRKHIMLLEQMKYFPRGDFDDALDALEMLVAIAKKPKFVTAKILGGDRDSGWYADYHRNFGWPSIS